jgi:hypothetical protein
MVINVSTAATVDLIDVIIVIAGPIVIMTTGIDVITAATSTAMIDVMTIVVMAAMIDVKIARMIVMTTSAVIAEMIDVMTDVAKTTTTVTTTTVKNGLRHHHQKGATPTVRSRWPTVRITSSSAVAKRPKAIDKTDQMLGRSGMSTPKTCSLCVGPNFQSLTPGKIIVFTSLTPGLTRWSLTP